ncbi:hypothetical protein DICPUDRAFT_77576 [Dictyostelium purpureum]|uniref:Rhamnolipids biosynthesis 3-oxoacyl-[acyl-carrier-protein] reductase n=1 Tax=Dictyostelium purpureum TaxID=5786 RepID=F0ZH14_DICPU|nr:uncharacterized protein DICPUDRAFT_77576 [Dictyostelium purpureum]EGC36774.1 hypothetical protein DICPUDRAFT_77576 [Dictyostelium purpureum]|eukprot:XP_003286720.1 hypothetical protein DICPUDRAFT_77576 [Dictyostelium purpureum]
MVSQLFDVSNKVILVTGGGSGIGYGISLGYVKNGCKVYICSRDFEKCKKTAEELSKIGPGKCIAIKADLSKNAEIKVLFKEFSKYEDHLDCLVNNSGCNWGEDLENYPEHAWDKVMNLNVKAVFYTSLEALPFLKKNASPDSPSRIINIGSVDGIRVPNLETYAYSTSKAALHQLTKVLANKLAGEDYNILVNVIACGPFMSKMTQKTFTDFKDIIIGSIATGRFGNNDDLEGLCVFLTSKASNYITGSVIPLEGGLLIKPNL